MEGWIKLHRPLLKKALWKDATSEQRSVLIALLLMANHDGNEWIWKGEKYRVKPGQVVTSLESIAQKAGRGISIQMVRTSLLKLEKLGFLTNESTRSGRLITITNWDTYQAAERDEKINPRIGMFSNIQINKQINKVLSQSGQGEESHPQQTNQQSNQQTTNRRLTSIKNDKNDNKKITHHTPKGGSARFDEFWNEYPKKVGKAKALTAWENKKLDTMADKIIVAVKYLRQSEQWTKDGGRYIPNPLTFINGERWEDQLTIKLTPSAPRKPKHLEAWETRRRFFHEGEGRTYRSNELEPINYVLNRPDKVLDGFKTPDGFRYRFEEFILED